MERKAVNGSNTQGASRRLITVLLPLLLLLLTQCVCSKGALNTSGGNLEAKSDKAQVSATKTPTEKGAGEQAIRAKTPGGVPLADVLNLKELDSYELADLESVLADQFDPCGKPISFRESLAKKKTCDRAIKMGNFVVDQITKGFSKKVIVVNYHKELKRLASRFDFDLKGSPSFGDSKSKNVIVEFTDFQCPHCQSISQPLKDLAKKHGAILYIKHLPLQIHPAARMAAKASLAAHQQGKFWEVYEVFFKNQNTLSKDTIRGLIKKAGVDLEKFDTDMKSAALDKLIERDEKESDMAGVEGTPTIFLNGYMVEFEELTDKLNEPQ